MGKYKYIIVDDDHLAYLPLQYNLKNYSKYECKGIFFNPEHALIYLKENEIDLIFLDIEMPEMSGFQFLEALHKSIFVVFLTAYREKYSCEAHQYYDKDLVFFSNKAQFFYYLPKIITRFEKMYEEKMVLNRVYQLSKNEIRTFPIMINNKPILLADIVYFKIFGHNTLIKMKDGEEHILRMSFRELKNMVPSNIFYKIRRNIIINIDYVTSFTETTVCVESLHIIISTMNRKGVVPVLKEKKELLYNNQGSK